MKIFNTANDTETQEFGKKIATSLESGSIVCLYGELGAGKTTFTKGLATGFGVNTTITSPTFTLMNVYPVLDHPARITTLIHIDTYRLNSAQELLDIGVEEYLGQPGTVTVIEWPEKIAELLHGRTITSIRFAHAEHGRTIELEEKKLLL